MIRSHFDGWNREDYRGYSTTSTKSNKKDKNNQELKDDAVKTKIIGTNLPGEKLSLSKPMDADFEKYLTGEMIPPLEKKQKARPPPQLLFPVAAGRDSKALYARTLLQTKEKARLKTAQTVNLALVGNVFICGAKFAAWMSSGSSGMLAEFIHSVVDCGNQGLLLLGLRDSTHSADRYHPYGYGKSVYFWALVSALGTFFLGAGVSMTHAISGVMDPKLHEITIEVWAVLMFSLAVDGFVLSKTLSELIKSKPKDKTFWKYLKKIRDPATLAILLEDGAACLGVVIALGGIVATHYSGNPVFDGIAGVAISSLLCGMGVALASMNYRFLLGQGVDREITDDIAKILLNRRSIDSIGSIQSQWTGPETFSYKAEVDFDGTAIAAELMTVREYQNEFLKIKDTMDSELKILLALYAEDVMRAVEREVRTVEALIRKKYPGAEYIELEPMSVDADRLAIDDNLEAELRRIERESLDRYLKSLRSEELKEASKAGKSNIPSQETQKHE
ncbi:hypothetical protein ACA910_016964 [Epithemia clementina (nom. ined.)]